MFSATFSRHSFCRDLTLFLLGMVSVWGRRQEGKNPKKGRPSPCTKKLSRQTAHKSELLRELPAIWPQLEIGKHTEAAVSGPRSSSGLASSVLRREAGGGKPKDKGGGVNGA